MTRTPYKLLITAAFIILGFASSLHAQSVTLVWDPNTEPDVAGYRVFYGTTSGALSNQVDVGKNTTKQIDNLDRSKTYYFAVQAYTAAGITSPLSQEVALPAVATRITGIVASTAYPLLVDKPVRWTVSGSSGSSPVEYQFFIFSPQTGWTRVQQFSQLNYWSWTPTIGDVGPHVVQVWARAVGSTAAYEAWISTTQFDVNGTPVKVTSETGFPAPPGSVIKWTAAVAGVSVPVEYKFLVQNLGTGNWTIARDYAASNQATWTAPAEGRYALQAWVRRTGSTAGYELWGAYGPFSIAKTPAELTAIETNVALPTMTGTQITWTARAKGGFSAPLDYQFMRFSQRTGWQTVQPYSPTNTYTWTPTWGEEGRYALQVWVRSAGSTASYESWKSTGFFDIQRAQIQLSSDRAFPAPPTAQIQWAAQVADPSAALEYKYIMYDQGSGTWSVARNYSTDNRYAWSPTRNGTYAFQVWARQVGSSNPYDVWRGTDYLEIKLSPARLSSLTANVSLPAAVGTPITWTAIGSGGNTAPLLYKFFLYTEGTGWSVLRDYDTSSTFTWTPTKAGNYAVQVWLRSSGSTSTPYESWLGSGLFRIQ